MKDTAAEEAQGDAADRDRGGSRWPWLLGGLVLIALAAGGVFFLTRADDPPPADPPLPPLVETAVARPAGQVTIRQTAFVRPVSEVVVTAEVTARIVDVAPGFDRGRRVAAGTVLVELDATRLRAELGRAEAGVAEAEAAVTEARIEADRQRELEDRGVAAETVLQNALVGLASAEAGLAAARADAALARDRVGDATLRAPFDALVLEAQADVGALAAASAPLGTVIAWDAVELELGLLPQDLTLLPDLDALDGALVRVLSADGADGSGGPIAEGIVTAIGPRIAQATRTIPLVVRVPDPFAPGPDAPPGARPLRVGELVSLELPIDVEGDGALALPAGALKPGGAVWTIRDGALVRNAPDLLRREVAGGAERVILRAGTLRAGDRVLLSDLPEAAPGLAVRVPDSGARP